jgi:hypothetical protein
MNSGHIDNIMLCIDKIPLLNYVDEVQREKLREDLGAKNIYEDYSSYVNIKPATSIIISLNKYTADKLNSDNEYIEFISQGLFCINNQLQENLSRFFTKEGIIVNSLINNIDDLLVSSNDEYALLMTVKHMKSRELSSVSRRFPLVIIPEISDNVAKKVSEWQESKTKYCLHRFLYFSKVVDKDYFKDYFYNF